MDDQHDARTSENGVESENGVHDRLPTSEKVVTVETSNDASSCSLKTDGLCASFDDSVKFNDNPEVDFSVPELTEVSLTQAEGNPILSSRELGEKESTGQDSHKPKVVKVVTKIKSGKLRSPKDAAEAGPKKIKDGKSVISAPGSSNGGILPSESRPTRSFESRTKSFNQRHAADGSSKRAGAANVDHSKQVGQSASTSSTGHAAQNESHMEKTKARVLKKSSSNNAAGMAQSIATDGPDKPNRVGALPAYGYSFRCNERAEKRKEFYSKLEEKIQAKEDEKSSVQAKTKETQEAEMRMLRKSLTFKATPLPNFYQEPAPQKAELKKVAPTRPKSPKLGRKKGTLPSVSEENRDANTRAIRSSLDEKSSQQNNLPKDSSSTTSTKKPIRKSLPKLPSQKTNLLNERRKLSDQKASMSKETNDGTIDTHQQKNSSEEASGVHKQEAERDPASIHAENVEPVVEFQAETTLVEEPVVVEH